MATPRRRKSFTVSDRLFAEPHRFSFFQTTRLLQGLIRHWKNKVLRRAVGYDLSPNQEILRFSSHLSLRFASTEIAKIQKHQRIVKSDEQEIAEVQVSFLGLSGQSGVLPTYLTELQLQRFREKDTSFQDFLDIFNHRAISFFYRAWEKYRLPFVYERARLSNKKRIDPITHAFQALLGISEPALQKQLPIDPETLIFYAGLFATQKRSADGLASSLSEYLDIPIRINQFKGEWMRLSEDDRCQLPMYPLGGKNNCLGVDTVIGNRVFTMEGKIEMILGPLNKSEFENIMPESERMRALRQYSKMFVGETLQFDVKYQLEEDSVSEWVLDETLDSSRRLGWNTWLLPENKADAQCELAVNFE